MLAAVVLAAVEAEERVKPLSGQAMLITLGLIVVVCAAILLAGFGYFSPSDD